MVLYRLLLLWGVLFFTFVWTAYGQDKFLKDGLEDSNLDRHIETAIVSFFGVLFVKNHDLTNFSNSRDKDKRILPLDLISKSKNKKVQQVITEAVNSVRASWVVPQKESLISFSVPGGLIYYQCHTDSFLSQRSDEDHCTACENSDGVRSIQLTKETVVHLMEICPSPL